MWALTVETRVPSGGFVPAMDPRCLNNSQAQIHKLIQAAVVAAVPQVADFSGPVSKLAATPVERAMKGQGGDLGGLVAPYPSSPGGPMCAPLVAVIPIKATMVGYRFYASEASGAMEGCGGECPVGWSKFQAAPVETKGAAIRTLNAVFVNWSQERTRVARMVVFYTLPRGVKPLMEI